MSLSSLFPFRLAFSVESSGMDGGAHVGVAEGAQVDGAGCGISNGGSGVWGDVVGNELIVLLSVLKQKKSCKVSPVI